MAKMKMGESQSTDKLQLTDEELKDCGKWKPCRRRNREAICVHSFTIEENGIGLCKILSDTKFTRKDGTEYPCPFYK